MKTTREGTSIIFENGKPVEINTCFVDALIAAQPGKYSKTAPGQQAGKVEAPKKENLKEVKEKTQEVKKSETDGKFTVEDLLSLEYKELQKMAKGVGIDPKQKKKELANKLFEKSQE
jgi:hypothetical protein